MNKKIETISQVVFLPASPAVVYEAFVDAEKHAAFTGAKATCEQKVGGKFTAWDGYIFGTILELEKDVRIVQEWKTTEWPRGYDHSIVELSFSAKGKGTELKLVHSKVPSSQAESYGQGWKDFYWKPLEDYLNEVARKHA